MVATGSTTGEQPAPGWDADSAAAAVGQALGPVRRVGVAFSGGVDSTVLLALCARVRGPANTIAILAVSESLPVDEATAARSIAESIGVRVVEIRTRELDLEQYRANGPDRCFFCKDELFTRIDQQVLAAHELDAVAYGENADDVRRLDRPGARAASDHGVLRPLARAGLTKAQVRAVARQLGLPNADKPAAPCLASRIPHHEPVTAEKLRQVEQAESALRALGFSDLRVRHHGTWARVELAHDDVPRAMVEPMHGAVIGAVRECGFPAVTIDPRGIRSGAFTMALVGGPELPAAG
jgi:uncharacterized protein